MGPRFTAAAELRRWTAAAVVVALTVGPVARAAEPTAKERVAQGIEFYNAGNYDAAIAEFKLAYEASGSPAILFPWAQAERLRGRCREAIDLYQRFIDSGPPEKQVGAAKQNRDDCVARIESADAAAASLVPGTAGEAPASEPAPPEPPPPEPQPEPPPRRQTDPIGWALLGAGVAVAGVAGGALLFRAARAEDQAAVAERYDAFADAKQ
jgi:tetratricopeptide (TPR) repeat protein